MSYDADKHIFLAAKLRIHIGDNDNVIMEQNH